MERGVWPIDVQVVLVGLTVDLNRAEREMSDTHIVTYATADSWRYAHSSGAAAAPDASWLTDRESVGGNEEEPHEPKHDSDLAALWILARQKAKHSGQ